jgi:hypothetical protein
MFGYIILGINESIEVIEPFFDRFFELVLRVVLTVLKGLLSPYVRIDVKCSGYVLKFSSYLSFNFFLSILTFDLLIPYEKLTDFILEMLLFKYLSLKGFLETSFLCLVLTN